MIDLDMLGELVRKLQADVRTLRSEVVGLRTDRNEMIRDIGHLLNEAERRIMDRIAAFEAHIDTRLDRERTL